MRVRIVEGKMKAKWRSCALAWLSAVSIVAGGSAGGCGLGAE
jgi:hypothetical protein